MMSSSLFCLADEETEAHAGLRLCYRKAGIELASFLLHKASPQLWELWENVEEACLSPASDKLARLGVPMTSSHLWTLSPL